MTLLVYRSLTYREFIEATFGAVRTTAMVLMVIGSAYSRLPFFDDNGQSVLGQPGVEHLEYDLSNLGAHRARARRW